MNKQNIIRITLFVSALAFNPAAAEILPQLTNIQTQQSSTVSSSIANILYQRGLDEDAAKEISSDLVEEEDEACLALMIENIVNSCNEITYNEILEYLSTEALHRKNVQLENYAQLTHMFSKIKQRSPGKETLKQLSIIAKHNSSLIG